MATEETKQIKVIGFYLTVVTLAVLFATYKACDSGCDSPNCRDQFIPESSMNSECAPGAVAEVVVEPKKGIICHCPNAHRDYLKHKQDK